jgi:hypothetical protein
MRYPPNVSRTAMSICLIPSSEDKRFPSPPLHPGVSSDASQGNPNRDSASNGKTQRQAEWLINQRSSQFVSPELRTASSCCLPSVLFCGERWRLQRHLRKKVRFVGFFSRFAGPLRQEGSASGEIPIPPRATNFLKPLDTLPFGRACRSRLAVSFASEGQARFACLPSGRSRQRRCCGDDGGACGLKRGAV